MQTLCYEELYGPGNCKPKFANWLPCWPQPAICDISKLTLLLVPSALSNVFCASMVSTDRAEARGQRFRALISLLTQSTSTSPAPKSSQGVPSISVANV